MDEALLPPHSLQAEQSVLGAVLMDNSAFDAVADVLQGADFYDPAHRAIYGTLEQLCGARKLADVVTVYEAGGHDIAYLNALGASVPSARAARAHALIVRTHAVRRSVMRLGADLRDEAMATNAADPAPMIDRAVTALLALQHGAKSDEPTELNVAVGAFIEDLEARADGRVTAIGTGLFDLDKLTGGGGRPGELWVLGARPSMGKTAMSLSLARHVGRSGRVLTLTQEDSLLMLSARHVAAAGRVNLADLRQPMGAPASMWDGVAAGVDELAPLQITVDDQAALTMADVRRKAQQVRRKHGRLDLLVIDYLQLMEGEGDNRNHTLGAIANGLKRLAKELNTWVVLLSQLNRKADERNGPPQMGDLRDSGDIEGAADLIGLIYREWLRKPSADNKHWAQLHVAKQKNGPTDTLNLYFDGAFQRFGNWSGPAPFRVVGGSQYAGGEG